MTDAEPARVRSRPGAAVPIVLMAMLGAWLAGCAPPSPGNLESLERMARRGAERRERALIAMEAVLVLRLEGRATGRLPAVSVQAWLAAPDRVRLQLRWLLGLALDMNARADTLTAWLPGERLGLRVPGLADSLGIREPARFLGRALVAGWQAPHEAWQRAKVDSAGVELEWHDLEDAWRMRVDHAGRPREVSVTRGEHHVGVRYTSWQGVGDAAWPDRLELADAAGWVRARLEIEDVRGSKRAGSSWFSLTLPADARRLDLEDVKRVLGSRLGGRR